MVININGWWIVAGRALQGSPSDCIYAYWEPFEDYRDQGCRVHMERVMFFILLKPSSSQGGKETAVKFEPSFAEEACWPTVIPWYTFGPNGSKWRAKNEQQFLQNTLHLLVALTSWGTLGTRLPGWNTSTSSPLQHLFLVFIPGVNSFMLLFYMEL